MMFKLSILRCNILMLFLLTVRAARIWEDSTNQRKLLQDEGMQMVTDPSIVFVVRLYNVSCSEDNSPFLQQVLDNFNVAMGCSDCASMLASVCPPVGGAMEVVMVSQIGDVPYEPMQRLLNTAIVAPQCILGELMQQEGDINLSIMHAGKFAIPDGSTPSVLVPLIDGCTLPGTEPSIGVDAAKKSAPLPAPILIPTEEEEEVVSSAGLASDLEEKKGGQPVATLQAPEAEITMIQFGDSPIDLVVPQSEQAAISQESKNQLVMLLPPGMEDITSPQLE